MAKDQRLYGKVALNFPRHSKIAILCDAAFRCLVEAILYSRDELTDGLLASRYAVARWGLDVLTELTLNDDVKPSLIQVEKGWFLADLDDHPVGRKWLNQRPRIPKWVRDAVMQRDGWRCLFCGAREGLSLDHIIRYRHGGQDTVENLRVLCMPCNIERG